MFGLFNRKRPIVFEQWITPILDYSSDSSKFYAAVEDDLKKWEMPQLTLERIRFKDGGPLSVEREYLRVRRESLVFDIVSARFGKSWWFSCRSAVLPRTLRWWELILFLILVCGFVSSYWYMFGLIIGSMVLGVSTIMMLVLMVAGRSWNGLDDLLLRLPVIGWFYENVIRAESYYRDDARRMYVSMVDYLVREKVKEFTAADGIEDIHFNEVKDTRQLTSLFERMHGFVAQAAEQILPSAR
jgi:hypothetical protein